MTRPRCRSFALVVATLQGESDAIYVRAKALNLKWSAIDYSRKCDNLRPCRSEPKFEECSALP
jgi:hypothetical protein